MNWANVNTRKGAKRGYFSNNVGNVSKTELMSLKALFAIT
jgi:hypothetical protein